jgi:hypothetical protein
MAVYSWDFVEPQPPPGKKPTPPRAGKGPYGNGWQTGARKDPPEIIDLGSVVAWAQNTGILCDGLRAVDLDIDDAALIEQAVQLAFTMLGETIVRSRENSPRCLLVYRAAEGEPAKLTLAGDGCKIEVLGKGQQFVAYGQHPSGAELQWLSGGPADHDLAQITAVTEAQINAFLNACVPLIGARPLAPPKAAPKANGHDHDGPPTAEIMDITAALALVPNDGPPDWEAWNNVGLAIYAATEGAEAGWALWRDWSAKNPADDPDATLARWEHYATSPPDRTGAGKLFAMAGAASPGWRRPSTLKAKTNGAAQPEVKAPPGAPPGAPMPEAPIVVDDGGPPEVPPVGDPDGPGNDPPLPVITCRAGELPRMIREAQAALLDSGAPIYQRSMLVQPTEQQYTAADGSVTHSAALVPLTAPALLKLMAKSAIYQKWDGRVAGGGGFVTCDPPDKLVNIVLHNRGDWPFPVVRGVLTCPTIRPDGSLLITPGYDPISRYYLMFPKGLEVPAIPDVPTGNDAVDALFRLKALLTSYPFVSKASHSVALAMLMTQVLRCAMPVSPLMAVSAKAPGTGKSHLVDLCSTIAIGRPCPAMGTGKKDEEVEKGINTMLIAGVPGFSIDNVSRDLDTPILNMATERPLITIRLFGVLEAVEIENAVTIYMTGNNLAIIDEQGRRTIRCELDAGQENPERRHFREDPLKTARDNRGRYIADVLTIARFYVAGDRGVDVFPIGSYGAWSRFVREPLVYLNEADPCATMAETAKDDPATARLVTVLNGWYDEFQSIPKTLADVVRDAAIDGFYPVLKEQFPARGGSEVDTSRMGYWLRRYVGRVVGGKRFLKEDGGTHHSVRWYVEKLA